MGTIRLPASITMPLLKFRRRSGWTSARQKSLRVRPIVPRCRRAGQAARPSPLAQQLNEQWIELLCQLAVSSSHPTAPRLVLQNRELLSGLDREARRRVAAFPFLIVDIRFRDIAWWTEALNRSSTDSDSALFNDLLLETLLFARQVTREDVIVAKTIFAMTAPVATLIASLNLVQVRTIAGQGSRALTVRWGNHPRFWREFLLACRNVDEAAVASLRREGKLLFCGEFIQ